MRRSARPSVFRPAFDLMEGRDCPAVTCSLVGGALTVLGDMGANAVTVSTSAPGAVEVTGDGQLFNFTGVQTVRVATGDGNDQVVLRVLEGAGAPVGLTATADLGGGDDTAEVTVVSFTALNLSAAPPAAPVVRLVYYPPYHSKYNPVERCWAALERKWRGGLLTSLEVILGYARRMTWQGEAPAVDTLSGEYPGGVTLTKAEMRPVEARLERSEALPKYDITIRPRKPRGR